MISVELVSLGGKEIAKVWMRCRPNTGEIIHIGAAPAWRIVTIRHHVSGKWSPGLFIGGQPPHRFVAVVEAARHE